MPDFKFRRNHDGDDTENSQEFSYEDFDSSYFDSDGLLSDNEIASAAEKEDQEDKHTKSNKITYQAYVNEKAAGRVRHSRAAVKKQDTLQQKEAQISKETLKKQITEAVVVALVLIVVFGVLRAKSGFPSNREGVVESFRTIGSSVSNNIKNKAQSAKQDTDTISDIASSVKSLYDQEEDNTTAAETESTIEAAEKEADRNTESTKSSKTTGNVINNPGLYKLTSIAGIPITDPMISAYANELNMMVYLEKDGSAKFIVSGQYVAGNCSKTLMTIDGSVMKYSIDNDTLAISTDNGDIIFEKYADEMPAGITEATKSDIEDQVLSGTVGG